MCLFLLNSIVNQITHLQQYRIHTQQKDLMTTNKQAGQSQCYKPVQSSAVPQITVILLCAQAIKRRIFIELYFMYKTYVVNHDLFVYKSVLAIVNQDFGS